MFISTGEGCCESWNCDRVGSQETTKDHFTVWPIAAMVKLQGPYPGKFDIDKDLECVVTGLQVRCKDICDSYKFSFRCVYTKYNI